MLTIRTAQLDILPGNIRANWALIKKRSHSPKRRDLTFSFFPKCV